MPARLFLFTQMEFPWELGPADGRYLLRGGTEGEPERVVVLTTEGVARRPRLGTRKRAANADAEAALVPTTRATMIDPVPLATEAQARAWLDGLDAEREIQGALAVLNRMLYAQRIATADPYLHELSPRQALAIRAGWGEGEQLAYGQWQHARTLPWSEPRARKRAAALRPQERLAVLLGAREAPLVCEEHTLRARLDFDRGRLGQSAIELELAYETALAELSAAPPPHLADRLVELRSLVEGVAEAAKAARPGGSGELDAKTIHHALKRLEALLRARSAAGFESQR